MELKQEKMLRQALELRERLLREKITDRLMEKKLARDHQRLANVWHRLDELDKATEHFRQAIALFEKGGEQSAEDCYRLAVCHTDFGDMLRDANRRGEAEEHFAQSLQLHAFLAQQAPDEPSYQLEAARAYNHLGILKTENEEHQAAKNAYDQAMSRLLKLEKADPGNREYSADIGRVLVNLGVHYEAIRKSGEAMQSYTGAIERLEQLRKTAPTKYENLFKLAMAYNNLGQLVLKHDPAPDRVERTGKYLREAVDLFERLTIDFPRNHPYRLGLSRGLFNLGIWRLEKRDLVRAEQTLQRAVASWEKLEQSPASNGNAEIKSLHGATLEYLAVAAADDAKKNYGRACDFLKDAVRLQQQARMLNPNSEEYRRRLRKHLESLILIAILVKDAAQASGSAADLSALLETSTERSYEAAYFLARRAEQAKKAGMPEVADSLSVRAIALFDKVVKDGYKTWDDLNKDANLAALRAHPAFQHLQAEAKKE
jgi:tetratricopeptide (TPR) repeat protein